MSRISFPRAEHFNPRRFQLERAARRLEPIRAKAFDSGALDAADAIRTAQDQIRRSIYAPRAFRVRVSQMRLKSGASGKALPLKISKESLLSGL